MSGIYYRSEPYRYSLASSFHPMLFNTRFFFFFFSLSKMSVPIIDYSLVPRDSLVLVTGVTGFIGSHIADQCLKAGFRVRGATRDTKKAAWVKDVLDRGYGPGRFEAVVVKDMAEDGAFDEAMKGKLEQPS